MCIMRSVRSGDLIREARLRAGLTQTELAARAGKAPSAIGRWERGDAVPSFETLRYLIRATGMEISIAIDAGDGIDRAQIVRSLEQTPAERLASLTTAARAIRRMARVAGTGDG